MKNLYFCLQNKKGYFSFLQIRKIESLGIFLCFLLLLLGQNFSVASERKNTSAIAQKKPVEENPGKYNGDWFRVFNKDDDNPGFITVAGQNIDSYGVDEYGAFITFYIHVHSKRTQNSVYAFYTKDGKQKILSIFDYEYYSKNQDEKITVNVPDASTGVRIRTYNGSKSNIEWNDFGGPAAKADEGDDKELLVRWYLPDELIGKDVEYKQESFYNMENTDGEDTAVFKLPRKYNIGIDFTYVQPEITSEPSSNSVGKIAVKYKYKGTIGVNNIDNYDYTISHYLDEPDNVVTDSRHSSPSGTLEVAMSNRALSHTFYTQFTGKGGYLTYNVKTKKITIPAYSWPLFLAADYAGNNSIILQWKMFGKIPNYYFEGDKFEIQRSTDSGFNKNVKNVGKVDYDRNKVRYQFTDNITDIPGGDSLYYRIRRTKSADYWGWDKAVESNAVQVVLGKKITADTAQLIRVDGTPKAKITWKPYKGVWLDGLKLKLEKRNAMTGRVASTIDLTEEEARSGEYVDDHILYCNAFTYTLKLDLGKGYHVTMEEEVPGSILAVKIGTISNLKVSKGYFPDRTELQWHSKGSFDNYIIKRKKYGTADDFKQIATLPGSGTSNLQTDDSKGAPGVYYKYMVVGAVECNNEMKYSQDTLYAIGFRAPTGNIYGRVTYENGQAVEDVAVRLQSKDDVQTMQSVYLNGTTKSYLTLDSLQTPFTDSAFTVEAWIRPDDASPQNQVVFSRDGQYTLGFDADGKLYFTYGEVTTVRSNYLNKNHTYVHVAGIHSRDSLFLMLNDSVMAGVSCSPSNTHPDKKVFIGHGKEGNNYKGYIDEMLVWNIAFSSDQIAKDYTRMLTGGEHGLAAYWRFDETIDNQFYDLSHDHENYNRNDGRMDPQFVKHKHRIPDYAQLSLKAYTDSTGNYMISRIPYTGQGTTYTIVPLFQTHQFDPTSVNRLISAGTSSFTVDFTDVSSFPVTGKVYYANSTVPVPGVQFLIDGNYAQKGNGELLETGKDGQFEISVPVGVHEVKAVKNSHVFVNGGRITDRHLEDLNYQKPSGPFTLYDSTTVRLIGRVAGGAEQEDYPLGHSLSKNNLGKELKLSLQLPSGTKYDLYAGNKKDSTVYIDHLLPSNQKEASQIHQTRVVFDKNKIVIYPDSMTGEFAVDLIPAKFIVESVTATGWGDLLDGKPVSLDLSNKFIDQYSVYDYKDSVETTGGDWKYSDYTDSVRYNATYKFIERVTPSVSIVQLNKNEEKLSYFGDSTYAYQSLDGHVHDVDVLDKKEKGKKKYLFGHPMFSQNQSYHFKVNAYEKYPFYVGVKNGVGVPAQKDNKPVIDKVPTQDGVVSFNNSIRDGATQADTLSLDSTGTGYYDFITGDPEIAKPGTKDFAASISFGESTHINWKWLGKEDKMSVFVMGARLKGTDFVTAGPNKMLMVLRDPPGNNSYSYVEQGSTISNTSTYTGAVDQVGDVDTKVTVGAKVITWVGFGAGVINVIDANTKADVSLHHEEHYVHSDTKTSSTTFTKRFQTSSDPEFVGAPADLYVGYSTNITYGTSDNLIIIKKEDLKETDSVISQAGSASPYLVVNRGGINLGQKFGTLFAYPQGHIVDVLIPNLLDIRNTLLLPSSTSPTQAQQKADNTETAVYVSKLSPEDPNFGKSNDDEDAFGEDAATWKADGPSYKIYYPQSTDYRSDSIMTLNQYIDRWQKEIAHNEKQKIASKDNLMQNFSFHSGSPVEYAVSQHYTHTKSNSFNIIVAGKTVNSVSTKIQGAGLEIGITESLGTQQGGSFDESKSSNVTMGFQLASEGTDEYLSVDVNKAKNSYLEGVGGSSFDGLTFITKGGETACPYEGASYTKYYQPGTLIDQPTAQIEVPHIKVDQPVINDVPSTQEASYTLSLTNESEAHLPATYVLSYANTDSIKGATIAVDGSSISSGRSVVVPYGETVEKVLTLKKGPEALNYNNIPIILHSSCQYDLTGSQDLIADTVLISAHFVPSCSNVNVEAPQDQWILNTLSETNEEGDRYIPVKLDNFDKSDSHFDHIELQYKSAADSKWITERSFYGDSSKYKTAEGAKSIITNPEAIHYNLVMDDVTFNDQKYDIRALAVCKLGSDKTIATPSDVVSGLKDTYNPRLFGTPEPGNSILGVGEDIRLNFNEAIAAGLLTSSDFKVTGIRNNAKGDHSVSVRLDGMNDYIQSEFDKNFTDKDITAEMWVLPDGNEDGTVFSQGNSNESMELAFTADNHLQVLIGSQKIKSEDPLDVQPGQWAHVALVYNMEDSTVSAFYNFKAVVHKVTVAKYKGEGPVVFGRSMSKQDGNYFAGKVHGVQIWVQPLTGTVLQKNSLKRLSGAEDGLLAYYPMTAGKGSVILDKAHGNSATLKGTWNTPLGKAVVMDGDGYIQTNTGAAPITSDMDFTISLWFKAKPGQQNATLVSNGKGDGTDPGTTASKKLFFLGFEEGQITFENNGFKVQTEGDYLDNQWHHVAVVVNRVAGTGRLLIDGELKQFFDTKNIGAIAAAYTYLGARPYFTKQDRVNPHFDRYFKGKIDEFRIWNTYLNKEFINRNNNVRLKGDELGLMDYYPFEKYYEFQGQKEMDFTLADQKIPDGSGSSVQDAVAVNADGSGDMAPIKDRGPVSNLNFDFVVNGDALIINLLEPQRAIDKTIVTLQVKDVKDLQGNLLRSPITWTAYIDQNPLQWEDEKINLSKKEYESLQFKSHIFNRGGSNEHFRLDNLPSWLTAEPSEGNIPPEGKEEIRFTVNKGLNVGTFNEMIFLRNENDETAALPIDIQVKGEKPDWQVKPEDFQYNMTVYGKIRIDGIFSDDPGDILAAFSHGKCVGVAHNVYLEKQDFWYTFLTVYSDSIRTGKLDFRIWDASSGSVYQGIPSEPISFENNTVVGNPDAPILFDGQGLFFKNIELQKGWNWISFDLINNDLNDISRALINGEWKSGDIIKHEERGFDQYSEHNGWVGSLSGLDNTSLFKVKTGQVQTLSISGTLPDMKKIPIKVRGNRWNYISYLPQRNTTIEEALSDYKASPGDELKSQTGFSMYSKKKGWVGNLTFLEAGQGYMLYRKSKTGTAFIYPEIESSLARQASTIATGSVGRVNPYQLPISSNFYFADNMTVVARVDKRVKLQPGDQILAYVGNELRGKAKAVYNPVINTTSFFFNISGKDRQLVHFSLERNGKEQAHTKPVLSYLPNSRVGNLEEPLMLSFTKKSKNNTKNKVKTYPSPFKTQVKIVVEMGNVSKHRIQWSVWNMKGQMVYKEASKKIDNSYYRTSWNGKTTGGKNCNPGVYLIHLLIDGTSYDSKVVKYKIWE